MFSVYVVELWKNKGPKILKIFRQEEEDLAIGFVDQFPTSRLITVTRWELGWSGKRREQVYSNKN